MMGAEFRYRANFTFSMRWAKIAIHKFQLRMTLLVKQAYMVDDVSCAPSVFGHLQSRFARFRHIRGVPIQQS
jgi:hypothetical protein